MLISTKESIRIFKWYIHLRILVVVLVITSIAYELSGCSATSAKQFYKDDQSGLSLEFPSNWDIETGTRLNNLVVLEPAGGIFESDSVRIEIFWSPAPISSSIKLEENLERGIDGLSDLYNLDSITIIQSPTKIENANYEIATATISIPTMAIPDDSPRNQVGDRDPKLSQVVDIRVVRDNKNHYLSIFVFRGNSAQINAEAEEIVNSIQFRASNQS